MFDVLPNTPSVWSSFGKNTLSDADWNGRIRSPTGFFCNKEFFYQCKKINLRTSLKDADVFKTFSSTSTLGFGLGESVNSWVDKLSREQQDVAINQKWLIKYCNSKH